MGPDIAVAVLIGLAVGAAAVYLLDRRRILGRPGRDYSFGWRRRSVAPLRRSREQLPPEELSHLVRNAELVGQVSGSALRRVLGLGAVASTDDLLVELISIEVRDAGGRCLLRFRPHRGALVVLGKPEVAVTDDLDTDYEIGFEAMSSSQKGGEANVVFAPRPPGGARRLAIQVERFGDPSLPHGGERPGQPGAVVGPWRFGIEIAHGEVGGNPAP